MRLTRAAQRAQHGDEADATDLKERTPLNEITPNASPELGNHAEELPKKTPAKNSKAKGGSKRGKKGKKGKAEDEEQPVQVVLEDEQEAAETPTDDAAVEGLAKDPSEDVGQVTTINERPASPPSKVVRLTRRQLAKLEEERKQLQQGAENTTEGAQEEIIPEDVADVPLEEVEVAVEKEDEIDNLEPVVVSVEQQHETQNPEGIAPSVEITSVPEPKTLSSEKPNDDVMTPVASRTSSRRASRSPSKSPMRIEDSIEALDALEEALENVEAVTNLHHSGDDKSPRKKAFPQNINTPSARSKTPRKTPLAVPKISRNPTAAPKSIKPLTSSLARASSVRVAPSQDLRKGSTDTVDYLASKRRPISVSFPTPPPPPKGRAPTKATFQLSSTAVSEKLKAEKEERLKRQAEGTLPKPRPVSINLPPKSTKPLTKANFELSGDKIAAELKTKREERLLKKETEGSPRPAGSRPLSMPPAPKSTKPLTKANFELPGSAVAARLKQQREERLKRQEEAEAAKKVTAFARPAPVRKSVALPTRTQTGVTIPPQAPSQGSSSDTSKRNSIQLSRSTSVSSPSRNSVVMAKSTVTPIDVAVQKVKGREVFNRDKMEKEAKEREKKEKEEAAKKARAEAAERGRIASREWAEKQKKKMMGMAA